MLDLSSTYPSSHFSTFWVGPHGTLLVSFYGVEGGAYARDVIQHSAEAFAGMGSGIKLRLKLLEIGD